MHSKLIKIMFISAIAALAFPAIAVAGDAAAGKTIFEVNCSTCHGMTGKGDGPLAPALNPKPRDLSAGVFNFDTDGDGTNGSDADLKAVITKGAAAFGGSPLMAPWPALADADVDNIIAFIRTLKP
jgi:mono/diheme cytochrome c family protein